MKIFSIIEETTIKIKEKGDQVRIGNQEGGEIGTVVGVNVRLQGTLKDNNDITVHGTVEGEVVSDKTVTVTETATIKGPVSGDTVIISGNIKGSIEAKSKIEILSSGKVTGGTSTSALIIHSGAIFNGKSVMPDSETPKSSQPASTESDDKSASSKEQEFELE